MEYDVKYSVTSFVKSVTKTGMKDLGNGPLKLWTISVIRSLALFLLLLRCTFPYLSISRN